MKCSVRPWWVVAVSAVMISCSDVGPSPYYCNDLYGISGFYDVKVIEDGDTIQQICVADGSGGGVWFNLGDTLGKWTRWFSGARDFGGVWDYSERAAHGGTQWRTERTTSKLEGCYNRFTLDYRWERTFDSGAPGDTIEVRLEGVKMTQPPSYTN